MPDNTLVQIPDMTVDEIEQTIYNLDLCIDSINNNLNNSNDDMTPSLRAQCEFVRDNILSSRNKMCAALIESGQALDYVVN